MVHRARTLAEDLDRDEIFFFDNDNRERPPEPSTEPPTLMFTYQNGSRTLFLRTQEARLAQEEARQAAAALQETRRLRLREETRRAEERQIASFAVGVAAEICDKALDVVAQSSSVCTIS